jgi:hypothetical protein
MATRAPDLNEAMRLMAAAARLERRVQSAPPIERRRVRNCLRSVALLNGLTLKGWRYPRMPSWTDAPDLSIRWG